MSRKVKVFDESMAVAPEGYNRTRTLKEGWTDGEVATPWGFVSVYAQGDHKHTHMTRLDFIKDGRQFMRTFRDKRYSTRGIKTKAMQFARDVVEGRVSA